MTEFLYQKLSFEMIKMKIVEFANSVDIDEPPRVDLHFLLIRPRGYKNFHAQLS